jgi:FG-GAP repeat
MQKRDQRLLLIIVCAFCLGVMPIGATEVASFQAGDGGWHMGTLAVGNLDADAQLEIVVPYRNSSGQWILDAFKADGTRLPGFPFVGDAEINVSPTLYDLDGDGRDEIIFTCGTRVIALRGNGSMIWSTAINRSNYVPNGGYMTVTNGFYWSNGGGFISRLPANAVFSSQVSSPMVADIKGTGRKQIVTAWKIDPDSTSSYQDYNPFINNIWGSGEWGTMGETWSGGVVLFDALTGAKDYVYHFHHLVESGLALGHADTNRPYQIYVLNDSDSVVCFDPNKPHGFYGNGNLHKQFGKNQRLMSGSYQQGVDVYTADIDGDGLAEVLVPTTQLNPLWQPNETILDDDGAILWRKWKTPTTYPITQWQNNACMIPANPDRDNHIDVLSFTHSYEIAFRYWNGIELVDHPGWPKNFYPYLPTPPVVGDVDGDGQEEIVIGTYNPTQNPSDGTLYVYSLAGALKFSVPVPGGLKHIPTLANVNGTGLSVIYRSLLGRIYIQQFGVSTGPVSWSTHRGNRQRDGNFLLSLFPPGTPLITHKESGYRRASFSWGGPATNSALAWRIFRAEQPEGPFVHIVTLKNSANSYVDSGLKPGCQYFYEVRAVYPTNTVPSAPFAISASPNNNLVANGGFEENDNSHWDKWFTGDIDWTNMIGTSSVVYQGKRSMQIVLRNNGNGGSIAQFGQYGTPDAYLPVSAGQLYSFGCFFKSGGISQPSEHWIEWSSTKTGENTNNRPVRQYPDYFTPHFVPGTNPSEWTYANRTFILPAGFPNVEIGHRYSVTTPASGSLYIDNVFFRALPPPASSNWTELIPFHAGWRYFTAPAPTNWFSPEFDDSAWSIGFAKFGAGSGPTNVTTPLPPRKPAYFFRRNFVLPPGSAEELLLSATCTEGGKPLQVYFNGVKLRTSGIEAVSDQGNVVRYYDLAPFVDLLRPGTNLIAIMVTNTWQPSWDDVAFDVSLKTVFGGPTMEARLGIQAGAGVGLLSAASPAQIQLSISIPPLSIWRVESADSLSGPWQFMDTITNTSPIPVQLKDVGQNGRPPPSATQARFYRLLPD